MPGACARASTSFVPIPCERRGWHAGQSPAMTTLKGATFLQRTRGPSASCWPWPRNRAAAPSSSPAWRRSSSRAAGSRPPSPDMPAGRPGSRGSPRRAPAPARRCPRDERVALAGEERIDHVRHLAGVVLEVGRDVLPGLEIGDDGVRMLGDEIRAWRPSAPASGRSRRNPGSNRRCPSATAIAL